MPTNKKVKKSNKVVDLLDEDRPISGQKFVCISFLSPEKIIKDKNIFNFEKFLNQWEIRKSIEKYNDFLHFLSYKYELNHDNVIKDFDDFVKEENENLLKIKIEDDYKNFLDTNEEKLEKLFNEEHDFETSVRGVKVRGVFNSQKEAENHCESLRNVDPNHDVYVGPVGMWMPFHPEAYKTGRVEYLESELNQLMNEKYKSEKQAKEEFDKRVNESKKKAIEDNIKKAEENKNLLTQTITEEGELINVNNLQSNEVISSEEMQKNLFESENVSVSET